MWVYRGVIYVKPGYIAEAIAHVKSAPPVEGVAVRVLRPVNGSEAATKLVFDFSFEDVDAYFASRGRPGPANAWMQRWIELNQSRGEYELYKVVHEVPSEGEPGLWVDRRARFVPRAHRREEIELWRQLPRFPLPGYSLRVMQPRTGDEDAQPLVVETTRASYEESEAFDTTKFWPEFPEWVKKVLACETRYPILDLLRVVD